MATVALGLGRGENQNRECHQIYFFDALKGRAGGQAQQKKPKQNPSYI